MKDKLGWVSYGGKHHESIYTKFYQCFILPKKFGADKRRPHLSCLINSQKISREQALAEMQKPTLDEDTLERDRIFVIKKLGISAAEFDQIMSSKPKTTWDYPCDEVSPPIYANLLRKYSYFSADKSFYIRSAFGMLSMNLVRAVFRRIFKS